MQDSTRSNYTILQMFHTKTFQIFRLKMFQQFLTGSRFGKNPVVQFESEEFTSKVTLEHTTFAAFKEYFFGTKIIEQLIHIIERSLCRQEFTGRDIKKGNTTGRFAKMHCGKEIIFFIVENIIIDRHTRSNQFCNATFHQFLRHLRIFQLITDSYTFTGTNQFW